MIEYIVKVYNDKTEHWFLNGKLHREDDLPAMKCANGDKEWWLNGVLYREDGLPAVECANGRKYWFFEGEILTEEGFLNRTTKPKPKNSKLVKCLKELLACLDDPEIRISI